jgi:hypothetical protein
LRALGPIIVMVQNWRKWKMLGNVEVESQVQ